ncbi:type VII secretion-associated protein [Saccharopolyspora subtropica]|uniref:Type VII secretion-associated protein n=1 Tax=Saccharopolyspora thermophila TaxID=89367 RepID=A0A917JQS9_9PSEU|nr:type VII secretion-associated protein [Saccharopolyspora subtropica]GGI79013.1 type VII secretion-associated protein [Saccharopolyspora subtropica]
MSLHVSIDFGTSSTCTVVSVGGAEPQVVVIDGQPLVPSAVFAAADGTLFVGHEAERQAAVDPARFEPHPKRRIDEGELLLGSSVLKVGDVVRAVLQRAVGEARRFAGGAAVDLLVLTHPADWGSVRTGVLRQAAAGLGKELVLVPEPVAAAVFHSAGHGLPDGGALAVLDLGGGTVDASVVRKQGSSFQVLATRGEPNFGGADIDQALLDHVGRLVSATDPEAWRRLVEGRELADRRRRRVLRQDVRGAKETLSRHTYTDVPMPPPFSDAHVTRVDLEALIAAPLAKAADLVLTTLREGNVPRQQLAGVFLVGGSSRIPLVARLIHERTGVVPTTLDQPETVVARGALRAVRLDPDRGGGLAPAGAWAGATTVRSFPVSGPPSGGHPAGPGTTAGDSLSRARTIVIGGSDQTMPVRHQRSSRRRARRTPWLVGAGAVAVVLAAAVGALVAFSGSGSQAEQDDPPRRVVQYDYEFDYPAHWKQIGGDPRKLQTLIGPQEGSQDSLVAVEEGRFDYDTDTDRNRAVQQLRAEYQAAVARGEHFSRFNASASFAGRDVVYYQETLSGATVDWYLLYQGQFRISVGCKYGSADKEDVLRACEQVVGSVRVR